MSDGPLATVPTPPLGARRVHAGLRLQIVLALVGLMVLAFLPLYFAVASLTRATVAGARAEAASALVRSIAVQVGRARTRGGPWAIDEVLRGQRALPEVVALCAFGEHGDRIVCEGDSGAAAAMSADRATIAATSTERASAGVVVAPFDGGRLAARLRLEAPADGGRALVQLVAMYMGVFALALVVFAAFALTRLIVRPVEDLVTAADRVASGARTLRVPRTGARELVDLGASVQAMAERLIAEEAALKAKVAALTETTTRLTDTQSQLVRSERMASVGRLAAGLAHEIGNPLAALMGMQDLLLDGSLSEAERRDFLERMRRETARIHAVVRDLLDFARPERVDAGHAAEGPASVGAVVADVAALVRPQRPFRTVLLETDVAGDPKVDLAAPRLTQVVLNLVLNAGAAMASAGKSGRVLVRARNAGARVRIEVEDEGPGVAPAIRERLFEPFATTKDVGEGTGLGLAVCRGLVESAGGEIGLDASYEGGARFYVELPRGG